MTKRRPLLGPFAAFAAFGLFWGAWAVLLPAIRTSTGASDGELGLALLSIGFGALPGMLGAGYLVDRLGDAVLPAALVAFGTVVTLPGFAGSVPQLSLSLLLVGAASGALDVAMNTAVSAAEAAGVGRAMQKAHASFSAAVVVAAAAVGLARELGAAPRSILLGAAVALVAAAWLNRGRAIEPKKRRPRRPKLEVSATLVLLGALGAGGYIIESGIQNWSALYLEQSLAASPAFAGMGPAVFAAAMALGRSFGDRLAAHLGDRLLLLAGALAAASGLSVAAVAPTLVVALLAFALAGAGVAVVAPALFATAGRGTGSAERGGAIATVTTFAYLGFLAGPPLMGAVSGATSMRVGWVVLAAVAVLVGAGVRLRPVRSALAPAGQDPNASRAVA